jgi:hypothetical protein
MPPQGSDTISYIVDIIRSEVYIYMKIKGGIIDGYEKETTTKRMWKIKHVGN